MNLSSMTAPDYWKISPNFWFREIQFNQSQAWIWSHMRASHCLCSNERPGIFSFLAFSMSRRVSSSAPNTFLTLVSKYSVAWDLFHQNMRVHIKVKFRNDRTDWLRAYNYCVESWVSVLTKEIYRGESKVNQPTIE